MAQLTTAEAEVFSQAFAKSLISGPAQAEAAPAAAIDLKAEFCKDWPSVKTGLQLLQSLLPAPANAIVGVVIAAGDALSKAICG